MHRLAGSNPKSLALIEPAAPQQAFAASCAISCELYRIRNFNASREIDYAKARPFDHIQPPSECRPRCSARLGRGTFAPSTEDSAPPQVRLEPPERPGQREPLQALSYHRRSVAA